MAGIGVRCGFCRKPVEDGTGHKVSGSIGDHPFEAVVCEPCWTALFAPHLGPFSVAEDPAPGL